MTTSKVYCYHCMTYHHPETMRKIVSRGRTRWRCIRSIEASRKDVAQRDAFGREQSALNLANARLDQERWRLERWLGALGA